MKKGWRGREGIAAKDRRRNAILVLQASDLSRQRGKAGKSFPSNPVVIPGASAKGRRETR